MEDRTPQPVDRALIRAERAVADVVVRTSPENRDRAGAAAASLLASLAEVSRPGNPPRR